MPKPRDHGRTSRAARVPEATASAGAQRLLPAGLKAARSACGLSQKRLSLEAGVDQSHLCALERGRGGVLTSPVLERVIRALDMSQEGALALRRAALHDSLMLRLAECDDGRGQAVISAAVRATWHLDDLELLGLEDYLLSLLRSRQALDDVRLRARSRASKEVAMT